MKNWIVAIFVLSVIGSVGCAAITGDPPRLDGMTNCSVKDGMVAQNCTLPDLATTPPACTAANGLAGKTLFCIDFDKITSLSDQKLAGWNIPSCWALAMNKSLSAKPETSGFLGCPLTTASFAVSGYSKIRIAINHKVNLDSNGLSEAQIFFNAPQSKNLLHQITGNLSTSYAPTDTTTIIGLDSSTLSQAIYVLNLYTDLKASGQGTGWDIYSIAINAQ